MEVCLLNGDFVSHGRFSVQQDVHIVSLVACEISLGERSFALREGDVTTFRTPSPMMLVISPVLPTSNYSELAFAASATQRLKDTKLGAVALESLCRSVGRWMPPHVPTLLAHDKTLHTFATGTQVYCVARKQAPPLHYRKLPPLVKRSGIREIAVCLCNGEPSWKQCSATFSTMMRHLQKAPHKFKWHTNQESKTTLLTVI
jgi:hypothetical protein